MSSLRQFVKSHPALHTSLMPMVRLARTVRQGRTERLSTNLSTLFRLVEEGSLVVRVPSLNGSFEIDCRSHILHRILIHGDYEPEVASLVRKTLDPGRDAIDIGANVGVFSVLLSRLVSPPGRVLAIEPTPGALKYLHRNLERNDCNHNVIVFEGAASGSSGKLALKVISGKEEYSSLGNLVHPSVRDSQYELIDVESATVDELVERSLLRPGFIKIDTEGAELDVLLGSERTLSTHRPVVLCESWDDELLARAGGSPGAIADLFRRHGYRVSHPITEEMLAVPEELARSLPNTL